MELELEDNALSHDRNPVLARQRKFDKDEAVLARFGKRQQLRRGFGLLPIVGLTSTLMITWEVITTTLIYGLTNGGPAGLFYGYLLVWCGASLQALVMAEMASMIPLAGGPFNWVSILSPPSCKNFLSYMAGWLTLISWQALCAGTAYVSSTMVQGLLVLNYPSYEYQRWHGTLLFYAVLVVALSVNTYLGRHLPQIESLMLLFHVLGFFAILIPLVYLSPHQPADFVFTNFLDLGGWNDQTLSFFVGLLTAMNSFPGLDAADHIAEEIQNAPTVIPRSMGISTLLNGTLGFAILMALLFCMPSDIQGTLNTNTLYPFMSIYAHAVGSNAGATAMVSINIITEIFATIGTLATASRMLWAFAREQGIPFSKYVGKVDERTHLPLYAIGATTVVNLLLALINIASSEAFAAFLALIVISYYSSFILAASVMLHKRLTTPDSDLPWGPFKLGRAGVPITVLAIAYSAFGAFFSVWPTTAQPDPQNMNYCILVFGAVIIFSLLFWFLYGRRYYQGPVLVDRTRILNHGAGL